jgi:arsenate reductase
MIREVLFVRNHNSVRSQMAEGLMNALRKDRDEVFSSGTKPPQVNPYATKSLSEIEMKKHIARLQ